MLKLITCVGVDYDLDFIPQWSRYYSQYGVDTWYVVLHSNHNDRHKIDEAKELFRANAQGRFVFWECLGNFHSNLKVAFQNTFNELEAGMISTSCCPRD